MGKALNGVENKLQYKTLFAGVIVIAFIVVWGLGNAKHESKEKAWRKCTVMEAADIYSTSAEDNKKSSFKDARITCEKWINDWGESDFINIVESDWNERKDELIEGKSLDYYLSILDW